MRLASDIYLELKLENFLSHEEELVFEKILSVEYLVDFSFNFSFHVLI